MQLRSAAVTEAIHLKVCLGWTSKMLTHMPGSRCWLLGWSSAGAVSSSSCMWPLHVGSERECPQSECFNKAKQMLKTFLWVSSRSPSHFCCILLIQKVTRPATSQGGWWGRVGLRFMIREGAGGQHPGDCPTAHCSEVAVRAGILYPGTPLNTTFKKTFTLISETLEFLCNFFFIQSVL